MSKKFTPFFKDMDGEMCPADEENGEYGEWVRADDVNKFQENVKELLKEVREAIAQVNKGAGHTVFNPAITQLVESMQKEIAD